MKFFRTVTYLFLTVGLLIAPVAPAVQPITGIQAAYDSVDDDSDDYSAVGGGTSDFPETTTYNIRFNVGSQNNLNIQGFEIGADVYRFIQLANRINIERVDNPVISGRHHIVLYEQANVSGSDIEIKASYSPTMEATLLSSSVNRGADNVFANTGDGNANNNNIERIDYIFPDGYPVFSDIDLRGFLVMDRGGNDNFKIAAITGLDSNGLPNAFNDPATVTSSDWGWSGINLDTVVMRGYSEDGGVQHPSANVGVQPLSGVYISWADLGLQTNDMIYGYALAANDVTDDGVNWTDVTDAAYFPRNTDSTANGGLDLMSGGAMFFDSSLDVTLGDRVWDDWNGNGIQDPGEPGISNVLVHVYDSQTNLAAITRTDADGYYVARGLGPGTYFVQFFLPDDYVFSPQYAGSNPALDSNADTNSGLTGFVTLGSGGSNTTFDAGMHLLPTDLRLTKDVNTNRLNRGDTVVYSLSLTNAGPYVAGLVQVTDLLPDAVSFDSYGASTGSYDSVTGIWDIGDFPVDAVASLVITGTVNAGYGGLVITNTAAVTRMNRPDSHPADNQSSALFTVAWADLQVGKTVDIADPNEGQTITFTITLTNLGPDDTTGVEVTDLLPAGLVFDSAVPDQGTYDEVTGVWDVGSLASHAVAGLSISAITAPGSGGLTLTNTATVSASDLDDPNPLNDSDDVIVLVQGADLALTKTVDRVAASEGGILVYTITVENLGPADTTGVEVTDPLAVGLTYTDDMPSQGAYDVGSGVWTVGNLMAGSNATLRIEATVNPGTMNSVITNTAQITASNLPDPNPANDQDSAEVAISSLQLAKSSDAGVSVQPGQTMTYTISVSNQGSVAHTDLTVMDVVPAGTAYVPGSLHLTVDPPVGSGGTTTVVYNASSTFVVPAGVTSVTVQAWGGGGGGGKAGTGGNDAGGGGGGGGYARGTVSVTPGTPHTVTVGSGGGTAAAGGNSWFGTVGTVFAAGGGAGGTGASVGVGGSANIGNQATFNGGAGGDGATGGAPNSRRGGGGGGSATATANGGAGQAGTAGGGGGTGEGSGGQGNTGTTNGGGGSAPGGGGGGGGNNSIGGAGADGRVIVTYDLPGGEGTVGDPPVLAEDWTLAPGSVMTITFDVDVDDPLALMAITNVVSVSSDIQVIPLTATVVDAVINVDLGVSKQASASLVSEGDSLTFTLTRLLQNPCRSPPSASIGRRFAR